MGGLQVGARWLLALVEPLVNGALMARFWWVLLDTLLRAPFVGTIFLRVLRGPHGVMRLLGLLGTLWRTARFGVLSVGVGLRMDLWTLGGQGVPLGSEGPCWTGLWLGLWPHKDWRVLLGVVEPSWFLAGWRVLTPSQSLGDLL